MTAIIPDNAFNLYNTHSMSAHPNSANDVLPVRCGSADSTPCPLLSVQNLHVRYGSRVAVHSISFALHAGSTVALVGESGSGKTTTALALCGLLPRPAQVHGSALLGSVDLIKLSPAQLRTYQGRAIGVIFQEPLSSLNPVLTIHTQIDEILKTHTLLNQAQRTDRIIKSLKQVELPAPQELMHAYPHQLSGGQRQRVMIAMAIACRPKILIADEPTTALDVITQKHILDLLHKLQHELNMAMILISHDLAVVAERSDQIVIMRAGQVVEQGPTAQVLQQPKAAYTRQLLQASLPIELNLHYTLNRPPLSPPMPARLAEDTQPLLTVQQLYKSFFHRGRKIQAVHGVDFDLHAGETLGLVGASGCGKSTLSRLIMQLYPPDSGNIFFQGRSLLTLNKKEQLQRRSRIQMVFQDPYGSLNPRTTIGRLFDQLQRLHFPKRSKKERLTHSLRILDAVQMSAQSIRYYPHEFSGGQRQRIAIARALLLQPKLLICDEPVSALDVSIQERILDLFIELKYEFNLSYLFISHDLAVVRYLSDRLLVMQSGKIVDTHYFHNGHWSAPRHSYTQSLMQAIARFPFPLPQSFEL